MARDEQLRKDLKTSFFYAVSAYRTIWASLTLAAVCLFVLICATQAVRRETGRRFHAQGAELFSIIPRYGPVLSSPRQRRALDRGILDVLEHDPSFILATAPEFLWMQKIGYGDVEQEAATIGVFNDYLRVFDLDMRFGRFITNLDSTTHLCVLGNRLWQEWARTQKDSLIGRQVQIGKLTCTVIGVLAASPAFSGEYRLDKAVLLPYHVLAQFRDDRVFTKVTIRANPARNIAETVDYIQTRLVQTLGDVSAFEISNQVLFAHAISRDVKFISIITGCLGSVALLFGSWQLLFIMITVCNGASGSAKTLGWFSRPFYLAFGIGLVAGLGGSLLGQTVAFLLSEYYGWRWQFSLIPWFYTILIICLITGLVGWRGQGQNKDALI